MNRRNPLLQIWRTTVSSLFTVAIAVGISIVPCAELAWTAFSGQSMVGGVAYGQEVFVLSLPGAGGSRSMASLNPQELSIRDAAGQTTIYQRLQRYDTPDGSYIGYGSRAAQRVIQWPTANSGNMRIGTLRNGQIEFAPSRMTVTRPNPTGGSFAPGNSGAWNRGDYGTPYSNFPNANAGPIHGGLSSSGLSSGGLNNSSPVAGGLDPDGMVAVQLAAGDSGQRLFLKASRPGQVSLVQQADQLDSAWYITPVGQDMVRVQQYIGGNWYALGVDDRALGVGGMAGGMNSRASIRFSSLGSSVNQLWRIQNFNGGGYCFESVWMPGFGLTCDPRNGLWLQPITWSPWQIWWPQQPVFSLPAPQYRVSSDQIVPNQPLPPVSLRVANTHTDTLLVLLADRRNPSQPRKLRIPAGGSETVTLERDAGATVIQTVEIMDAFGNWNRDQYQIPVPPAVLYDMSVYEEFLQSIAIDRTGKSPSAIEDVNYQPRSIGFFLLPAGAALEDRSVIDAYRAADDSKNPGACRKLSPRDFPSSSSQVAPRDPLKDLLQQLQGRRGAF
jgi:hypothetical protein